MNIWFHWDEEDVTDLQINESVELLQKDLFTRMKKI